jgi:2-isopropylmalate synthase
VHQLQSTREDVKGLARASVAQAKSLCEDVEFSPMDATRSEAAFTAEVVQIALDEGATTINIPDTVGYTMPDEFAATLSRLYELVPGLRDVTLSVHCHDDLGLAVANSLAGVGAGARQVECSINGLGERAGNASLEEIVMALRVRRDRLPYDTGVRSEGLFEASQLLSELTNEPVQSNKAIVGRNAFAHEAGIHQDGMLKDARTYEIMRPQDVGQNSEQLVLGRHSGRHAVHRRAEQLGLALTVEELALVYQAVVTLGEHRKAIADNDLRRMVERVRAGQTTHA